jgi:hypothetical protein
MLDEKRRKGKKCEPDVDYRDLGEYKEVLIP